MCISSQVLMRALRDFNMPKIVTEDVAIFLGLLSDLFPGLEVERERSSEFEKAVRQTTLELRLQPEEPFILKVQQNIIQILNQMNERKSANEEFCLLRWCSWRNCFPYVILCLLLGMQELEKARSDYFHGCSSGVESQTSALWFYFLLHRY